MYTETGVIWCNATWIQFSVLDVFEIDYFMSYIKIALRCTAFYLPSSGVKESEKAKLILLIMPAKYDSFV